MALRRFLQVGLPVMLALGACGGEKDRPPPRPSCSGDDCSTPVAGISPVGGGSAGATGTDERADVTGSVVQFGDTEFLQVASFSGSGTVQAFGLDGAPVIAEFDGGSFVLTNVEASRSMWTLVEPASGLFFPTWSSIDTSTGLAVSLPVVPFTVIEEIMNLFTIPTEPLAGTAQVVVRVVNSGNAPLAGVTVAAPAASVIAYATMGTWSDVETVTSSSGLVLLGNASASPVPGNDIQVTLSGGASGTYAVRAAANTLTFVHLQAP